MRDAPLYRLHELSIRTHYAELKERVLAAGPLLAGTPGSLVRRNGAWLNELGAIAVSARTLDIDLAAQRTLKLAAPMSFMASLLSTRLGFVAVPGMPSQTPPTSVKLGGREGLSVDLLTHGTELGATVPMPQLSWHARAVPHYDYLMAGPRNAALLAGGHCVPVRLPAPERLMWHKLYASSSRQGFPEKAAKDLLQAATLAALVSEQQDEDLAESYAQTPPAMRPCPALSFTGTAQGLGRTPGHARSACYLAVTSRPWENSAPRRLWHLATVSAR